MSTLDSLVRLHRLELDEARKVLAEREHRRAALQAELGRLDEQLAEERHRATESFEANLAYGGFAAAMKERKEAIALLIREADETVQEAADIVAAAFRELKKYEIAAEHRAAEERREAANREQQELNEVALGMHRRKAEH